MSDNERANNLRRLQALREELENDKLKDLGLCLPCRGSGRRSHHSRASGCGISWQCEDCKGTGIAKK